MGANHRKACAAFAGLLCLSVAAYTSSEQAIASQGEPSSQRRGQMPNAACPSQEFATFLQRYADAADDDVRRRFTDDPLEYEVPTHTAEEETASSPISHISERTGPSRLELFPFRYFKDAGVFDRTVPAERGLGRQGKVGYPVSIQAIASDGRTLDFGIESEVDTYVFKRSQGCWYLTRAINLRD
ncbi:hypothetical protein [Pseudomonas quasicaspiana]|uniref:hypothetical protein n=1 Tax=Pseudomonas quasicaspiana TaxID=2829821 RepID=UPI001E50C23E|nr:hypothetical protein [Pseudomonas quasicaspiana]MCD5976607.1 hypothetical protein [Pseudomonas quasicaspiana]